MIEHRYTYMPNNTEALHERLKQVFGERYLSMDSSDIGGLIIRMQDQQPGDNATIAAELNAHDPEAKTRRQIKAADKRDALKRLRELDVNQLRDKVGKAAERDALLLAILDALEDLQKQFFED